MSHPIVLQSAFILHTRPYRDTSLLLEIFTAEHGRVSLVAKGVRGVRSRFKGLLQPFVPLLLSWQGKSELMTLVGAESNGMPYGLSGDELLCGIYLNELLMRLLHRYDAHPALFQIYQQTLSNLQTDQQIALRLFEKKLLSELGYALQLEREAQTGHAIDSDRLYYFEPARGLLYCDKYMSQKVSFRGENLLAIHQDRFSQIDCLRDAKRLFRSAINYLLNGKSIRSRELFL